MTITRQIASGGMSEVYEGTRGSQRVAVKLLHAASQASRNLLQALVHEAELMQRLRHPNLLEVLDAGQVSTDAYFIVMPYAAGGTLRQRLADLKARGKQMSELEALQIAHCVASALEYVHAQGIVHRDIKPSNILFMAPRAPAKLGDFGVAVEVEEALVHVKPRARSLVLGTPEYAAPEQAQGHTDVRADLYALGIVLYEMLAGAPPFRGRSLAETTALHATAPLPALPRRVSPQTLNVLARATAKNPLQRFQSAREMRQALEQVIATLPLHALIDPLQQGARRFVVPALSVVVAVVLVMLSLLVLLVVLLTNRLESHLGAERTWSFPPIGVENRLSQSEAQRVADRVLREATLGALAIPRVVLGPTRNRVELELQVLSVGSLEAVLWVGDRDGIPAVALVRLGAGRPPLLSDVLESAVNRGLVTAWQRHGYQVRNLAITPSGEMIFTLLGPASGTPPVNTSTAKPPADQASSPTQSR
ncbi:MAG: serine/threonine protein kinase [Thermoflexales bacterium]|nr:serine/threonine protein kinase [Thermoflexales bacterium]